MVLSSLILKYTVFNSLPNDNLLNWTKFKASADVTEIMISDFGRVENVVGKGENASYQHFLLFSHFYKRLLFQGPIKL